MSLVNFSRAEDNVSSWSIEVPTFQLTFVRVLVSKYQSSCLKSSVLESIKQSPTSLVSTPTESLISFLNYLSRVVKLLSNDIADTNGLIVWNCPKGNPIAHIKIKSIRDGLR